MSQPATHPVRLARKKHCEWLVPARENGWVSNSMFSFWLGCLFTLLGCVAALGGGSAFAEKRYGPGVTDSEIKIGQTMPYSGPASAYATTGRAQAAYFAKINSEGGIHGRKIKLISLDDGYSPPKTVEQMRKLVEQEQVLFIFSSFGTPPNIAVAKYLNARKVPHLFVASGASAFGDFKTFPWSMGWRPNYVTEGQIYAKYVLKNHPNARIAVMYQHDDVGKDYLEGLRRGFGDKTDRMIVATASFEISDPTVDSQIGDGSIYSVEEWPLQATLGRMRMRAVAHSSTEAGFEPARLLRNSSRRSRHMDSTVLVVRGRPSCGCIR